MKFSYPFIKKLFPKAPPREKAGELLNLRSFEVESVEGNTLDIKLPANRYSDCASHIGIAREVAAASGSKLNYDLRKTENIPASKGFITIRVDEKDLCVRYAARVFQVQRVGPSSPEVQKVLGDCGLKPINNIVDIMNYVMLETGQPLHAFDLDKLASAHHQKSLIVRFAKKKERLETLDKQMVELDPSVLVIADNDVPQAIAGVKGGMPSGVVASTKRIVVEAANFDPALIFRTSRRLKLPTDAALRFSHGMSPALVEWGMERATELLKQEGATLIDSAEVSSWKSGGELVEFDCDRYAKVIGAPVKPSTAKLYFERLGFGIEKGKFNEEREGRFMVRIPAWRNDIENMEGLMEEVARLQGFDALPPQAPRLSIVPPHEEDDVVLKEKVRGILTDLQLDEVYNSTFAASGSVEVENPVSDDKKFLRTSLLPHLEANVRDNARYFDGVRIFEIGKIFEKAGSKVRERASVGIVIAAKKNPRVALELKGLLETFLAGLGIDDVRMIEEKGSVRVLSDGTALGAITHKGGEKQWSLALAELDLGKVLGVTEEGKEYVPLKRFPAVVRDVSVLVDRSARIGDVMEAIESANKVLIENIDLIDEYKDEKLGGRQSLTFRVIFQADDRTLTDAEVNGEMEKIVARLRKEFRADIR